MSRFPGYLALLCLFRRISNPYRLISAKNSEVYARVLLHTNDYWDHIEAFQEVERVRIPTSYVGFRGS